MIETAPLPTRRARLLAALGVASASAAQTYWFLLRGPTIPDFFYWWSAARILLSGVNPYAVMGHNDLSAAPPYDAPFGYPMPTILAAVPLAGLPMRTAAVIFAFVSGLLLAYCVTRRAWWPLVMCGRAPYVIAVSDGQWSPIIVAAAFVPRLAPLLWFKPTLGLAALAYARDWRAVAAAAVLGAATLVVLPSWPIDWVRAASRTEDHPAAIATTYGPLLLLALLRWRQRRAWVLLVAACVPQLLFFYDQLILWLIPRTRREAFAMSLISAIGLLAYVRTLHVGVFWVRAAEPWVMGTLYLPALLLVLRHPNVGVVPAWVERSLARLPLPSWLRGSRGAPTDAVIVGTAEAT
jgi:hypothetical protein